MAASEPPERHSVVLIGSSGGGTATLGHTDPVELLTTVHRELLRVGDGIAFASDGSADGGGGDGKDGGAARRRRVCVGLSHAIFVSLRDGSGFDSVKEEEWRPAAGGPGGPTAALYAVGFEQGATGDWKAINGQPFRVTLVKEGPLTQINNLAQYMDVSLSETISRSNWPNSSAPSISAMISMSSEPTAIHAASLGACNPLDGVDLPIVGSGGTSLSRIASLYDLRIVGNSGGSVASTTLTKARRWARGLAEEWGMIYDANFAPTGGGLVGERADAQLEAQTSAVSESPVPTMKSILEAALPAFLFVCLALRLLDTWAGGGMENTRLPAQGDEQREHSPTSMIRFALRHLVPVTTCCILAATSRSASVSNQPNEDQSTLLMEAVSTHYNGGSALAGLVSGALVPVVLSKTSRLCNRYHVTATMTNILCGGGVGMLVGMTMHLSGIARSLSLATGAVRSLIRWRRVIPFASELPLSISDLLSRALETCLFPELQRMQEQCTRMIPHTPALLQSMLSFKAPEGGCSLESLPVPTGLGFLFGCFFVYGSKIGLYHSLFLPAILLEMDSASKGEEASLLGAIDECTLVMVCSGICAANLILPPQGKKSEKKSGGGIASLSWQALKTNILCGDFIEAAYPSMERSAMVNGAAYLAAGLSTEVLLQRRVLSTAYLPLPLSIWISNDRWGMAIASSVTFAVSFLGTIASNAVC
ncbi:hypothetical protein ACHAXT_003536 [Thalassiosira profunda]